jgi:hypothetical protein
MALPRNIERFVRVCREHPGDDPFKAVAMDIQLDMTNRIWVSKQDEKGRKGAYVVMIPLQAARGMAQRDFRNYMDNDERWQRKSAQTSMAFCFTDAERIGLLASPDVTAAVARCCFETHFVLAVGIVGSTSVVVDVLPWDQRAMYGFLEPYEPSEQHTITRVKNTDAGSLLFTRCALCMSETGLKRCSRCLSVLYCGKQCQAAHWSAHKKVCHREKGTI